MNEQLNISPEIQAVINNIQEVDLHLAELPMPDHPLLPQFERRIRVNDIDVKSKNQFVSFTYEQVLFDRETGDQVKMVLPTPEWVVYKDTWSYLRDSNNEIVEGTLKEEVEDGDLGVKVPSYMYMLWLMKNNTAGLLQLIENYLEAFVQSKINELNG